jgi:hypothetical protein
MLSASIATSTGHEREALIASAANGGTHAVASLVALAISRRSHVERSIISEAAILSAFSARLCGALNVTTASGSDFLLMRISIVLSARQGAVVPAGWDYSHSGLAKGQVGLRRLNKKARG